MGIRASHLIAADRRWSGRLAEWGRSRTCRLVAGMAAHSGDSALWLVVGILGWWMGYKRVAVAIGVTVLFCALIAGALKLAIRRQRPLAGRGKWLYLPLDAHSFPSGHATRVAALALVVGGLCPSALPLLLIWAVLVALARVVLGIHYLSDVLAGLPLGFTIGLIIYNAFLFAIAFS